MWLPLINAAESIRAGGVLAYPTEAVYGLGCDPLNAQAVARLLMLKQRPVEKGLILLAANLEQLQPWIRASDAQWAQMAGHWPGPVTFLAPCSARVPVWIRGEHDTVAVRVSGHPLARRLAELAGTAIVSTSANRSGAPAARNRFQIARQWGDQLDAIVAGDCNLAARPSRIIDLQSGRILRD